jgi:hypothetical protein
LVLKQRGRHNIRVTGNLKVSRGGSSVAIDPTRLNTVAVGEHIFLKHLVLLEQRRHRRRVVAKVSVDQRSRHLGIPVIVFVEEPAVRTATNTQHKSGQNSTRRRPNTRNISDRVPLPVGLVLLLVCHCFLRGYVVLVLVSMVVLDLRMAGVRG